MTQIYPTVNNDNKYIENRSINEVKPANTFGPIQIEWVLGLVDMERKAKKLFRKESRNKSVFVIL